jgi:hypothetical protein
VPICLTHFYENSTGRRSRPKGRQEGTRIEDYVVEDYADHVVFTSSAQEQAIIRPTDLAAGVIVNTILGPVLAGVRAVMLGTIASSSAWVGCFSV